MEHLWLDPDLQVPPDRIPYYDIDPMLQYDEEWRADTMTENPALDPRQFEIFLQEYCFFGLLTEYCSIMETTFDREDFICREASQHFLTTARLPALAGDVLTQTVTDLNNNKPAVAVMLSNLAVRASQLMPPWTLGLDTHRERPWTVERQLSWLNSNTQYRNARDAEEAMGILLEFFTIVLGKAFRHPAAAEVDPLRLVSCCSILESLTELSDLVFGHAGAERSHVYISDDDKLDPYWLRRCEDNHVCPQRLQALKNVDLPISQCYIATSLRLTPSDHSNCTFDQFCQAKPASSKLPKHVMSCTGHDMITLKPSCRVTLEQSISECGYGVLQFTSENLDDGDFIVKEAADYVALSHVWSHGLGNPEQNGLPECQLIMLKRLMHEADCPNHCFWLDPICVPLNSRLRMKAIANMDKVYTNASKVIIVDRDIIRCRGNNIIRRIMMLITDWGTRIWTLQEATFPADKLYVACADGLQHVGTMIMNQWNEIGPTSQSLVIRSYDQMLLQSMLCTNGTTLVALVEAFHNRATTNPADELICLCILLGKDVSALPASPTMSDVIGLLEEVEQDIIFAPGARCNVDGYRWCPHSLISARRRKTYEPRQSMAVRGPRGVRLEKTILVLGDLYFTGMQPDQKTASDQYMLVHPPEQSRSPSLVVFCAREHGATDTQLRPRHMHKTCLILEKTKTFDDEEVAGVLASDTRMLDGSLQAHYECLVMTMPSRFFKYQDGLKIGLNTNEIWAQMAGPDIWID